MTDRKVLLINPSETMRMYKKVKVIVPEAPNLTLATLAAPLVRDGHRVRMLDLAVEKMPADTLTREVKEFKPDFVGITFATPTFYEMVFISNVVRKKMPTAVIIGGGPHASTAPEECLTKSALDIVVIGEGDRTLPEIVRGMQLQGIKGICFKKDGAYIRTEPRPLIEALNSLELPAWSLYDLKRYKSTRSLTRETLVGFMETSRGCPHRCIYCNKSVFGSRVRLKSPERVVDEMQYLLDIGFKEIHPQDDAFSVDLRRAKRICEIILARNMKFPWVLGNGLRIDMVDEEFLKLAYRSGCYKVQFGIESASQDILDRINKRLDLSKVKDVVEMSHRIGLEVATFFIFGLPGETEESLKKGIELAIELNTLYTKVSILTPYPGTPIWNEWVAKGHIKSKDWSLYNFHNDTFQIYDHPDIDMNLVYKYYRLFYRGFYFRLTYLIKRLKHALKYRHLMSDAQYFIRHFLR